MRVFLKWIVSIVLVVSSFLLSTYDWAVGSYNYDSGQTFENFEDFYRTELEESKRENVRPENEEFLFRYSEEKTPIAILYIHGFGASRKEGEEITQRIAESYGVNTYYLRLPGHGTTIEDHRDTEFNRYLQDAERVLHQMHLLGEKTVIMGTSMGGLIGSYLAGKHPDKVKALVLASPFFDFGDPTAVVFRYYWGKSFVNLLMGEIRISKKDPKDESNKYWYMDQYYAALQNIMNLKKFVEKDDPFPRITSPTLLLYYYKSEKEQDFVASVPAMKEAFQKIQSGPSPSPDNKLVQVEDGAHVLLSRYVKTDKDFLYKEISSFLEKTTNVELQKSSKKSKRK